MQEPRPTTVVLADDQVIVREGLAALLRANGWHVLAECSEAASAFEAIESLHPDFAVLDLHGPGLTTAELIRNLRKAGSAARLIVLSAARNEATVMDALRAGADAYVVKDGPSRHFFDAAQYVRDGGVYLSPLLGGAALFVKNEGAAGGDPLSALSQRERQVFAKLVTGLRAKEIAEQLDISPKTIDTYRASLMRKLDIHDMVGLVRFAISRKLISPEEQAESE